ncbi:MAG TPA: endonuclease/exonuclease/phosphatase family protein [Thermohalobaculum sp.]|nr:endonuclease/exonuclease/phosphatase family protein [Thermohalobaculum sp.]
MRAAAALALGLALAGQGVAAQEEAAEPWEARDPGSVRVAAYNVALSRRGAGLLAQEMAKGGAQIDAVAEIIGRVRPDILVLYEFDRDPAHLALSRFAGRLRDGAEGLAGLDYPFLYQGPVNTGVPSGHDLDGDGWRRGPRDAFGFGHFPGQYGTALLSRFPIDHAGVRGFRRFRWADLPGADRPVMPDGTPFHADAVWQSLRLSSKSLWDVPVTLPGGAVLHVLASHPTPPVFDGPEDLNGRRNADEIRLLTGLIEGASWIVDDAGRPGGLDEDALFVVAGDLNADPFDGAARRGALRALLAHPRLQDPRPASEGAEAAAARQGGANARHEGPPGLDTADWRDEPGPGNLRVDYVLPSAGLEVTGAGVFWPPPEHPLAPLLAGGRQPASSDHRLVWVDIAVPD